MDTNFYRRSLLRGLAALAGLSLMPSGRAAVFNGPGHSRAIPSSGERLPAIGLGTAYTFDVPDIGNRMENCTAIIRAFFELGGAMIDSAPMYGRSETVIGNSLQQIGAPEALFSATKVWIPGKSPGVLQMERSLSLWGEDAFDLIYVHNLVDWETHLPWLREWKADGRARYIGVTTSHGRRHEEIEHIMRSEELDFVQFTYNIGKRSAEQRLLPLARDRGMAVVINRPFERGGLFRHVQGKPLPPFAADIGCSNWAQFFLKFIISHPHVTCAIPATSNIEHLRENMGALHGPLPNAAMRSAMTDYFETL